MAHLCAALSLYAALVAQVAIRYGGGAGWTPNLLLLAGFIAAGRPKGGMIWAAVAGLACDTLSGRPLGVTMLVATLTATAFRVAAPPVELRAGAWRLAGRAFVQVFAAETAARLLAATVLAYSDHTAEVIQAARVAGVTGGVAFCVAVIGGWSARFGRTSARTNVFRAASVHR